MLKCFEQLNSSCFLHFACPNRWERNFLSSSSKLITWLSAQSKYPIWLQQALKKDKLSLVVKGTVWIDPYFHQSSQILCCLSILSIFIQNTHKKTGRALTASSWTPSIMVIKWGLPVWKWLTIVFSQNLFTISSLVYNPVVYYPFVYYL